MMEYPDLPGCVSDGNPPEEAVLYGRDAVKAYLLNCVKQARRRDSAARSSERTIRDFAGFDPAALGAVGCVILLAGAATCLWPARRAARIDPAEALRNE